MYVSILAEPLPKLILSKTWLALRMIKRCCVRQWSEAIPWHLNDGVSLWTPRNIGAHDWSTLEAQFYVDSVSEIRWNLEAFERLVLPHDYKQIIWAFVESQLSHENRFDDVVQGKGMFQYPNVAVAVSSVENKARASLCS